VRTKVDQFETVFSRHVCSFFSIRKKSSTEEWDLVCPASISNKMEVGSRTKNGFALPQSINEKGQKSVYWKLRLQFQSSRGEFQKGTENSI